MFQSELRRISPSPDKTTKKVNQGSRPKGGIWKRKKKKRKPNSLMMKRLRLRLSPA